jgi:peptide/nickel transport system ATP-binding protein
MGSIIVPEAGTREVKLTAIPGTPPNLKNPAAGCRFAQRCKYAHAACKVQSIEEVRLEGGRMYRCILDQNELKEGKK